MPTTGKFPASPAPPCTSDAADTPAAFDPFAFPFPLSAVMIASLGANASAHLARTAHSAEIAGRNHSSFAAASAFISHAMFRPRVRIVATPSSSFSTSPISRPTPMFQ